MLLSEAVKKRRKELGMTQKEVAKKACIDPVTVSVFERNARKISLDIFLSIVYALDMQVELTSIDGGKKNERYGSPYDDYCYECKKHGDGYRLDENGEWVSACDDCPFNDLREDDE